MIIDFEHIAEERLVHFKGGEKEMFTRQFIDESNKIMRSRLNPGASIGIHTHDDNCEFIFITSGEGTVLYDGESLPLKQGQCHYCPKGHTHGLVNDSNEVLEFFAVVAKQ